MLKIEKKEIEKLGCNVKSIPEKKKFFILKFCFSKCEAISKITNIFNFIKHETINKKTSLNKKVYNEQ